MVIKRRHEYNYKTAFPLWERLIPIMGISPKYSLCDKLSGLGCSE